MKKVLIILVATVIFLAISSFFPVPIAEANSAPIWNTISEKYVQVGKNIQFRVSALDPEGDYLSYYAMYVPIGAYFNKDTQIFNWTPNETGFYLAKFRVFDQYNSFSDMDVAIEVGNHPPRLPAPEAAGNGGQAVGLVPQIIVVQVQPQNPPAPVIIERIVEKEPEAIVTENRGDNLNFGATLIGIIDNILFNPWILLIVIVIVAILLYRSNKKMDLIQQELALKNNYEAKNTNQKSP